jgi:hypothetical protein
MDGEQETADNHSNPLPPDPIQIPQTEHPAPEDPATAQQLEEVEEKMSGFERSTLRWARTAVIVSGFAFVVVCAQWYEMHTSGTDTHNLAVSAGNQATWTQALAKNMQTQADRTKDLADRMKDQTDRTKDVADRTKDIASQAVIQAGAAINTAETARDALQIGNRPWVKITPAIVEPLTFKDAGATMTTDNIIENVGSSVALHVLSWEDVIPLDPDGSMKTARARQEEWCGAHRHIQKGEVSGSVLFPHDPKRERMGMGPPMSKVNEAKAKNALIPGKVGFVLVGCVSYRSSFESDTAFGHQTRFIYRLGIPHDGVFQPYIDPVGTADQLRLIEMPDGFAAD